MALDPCSEGCLNHNIGANTVPVAGDDPCNNAGNGFYCQGSYWSYDPNAAGADTDADGDCARLFLRTGGDCLVDQWLEIQVAEMRVENRDPIDGDDCCPPGTLWSRVDLAAPTHWISINDGAGGCQWCRLGCTATAISYGNNGIPEPIPDSTTVIPIIQTLGFDIFNELNIPGDIVTLATNGGRYQFHIEAQITVVNATPRLVVRFGADVDGAGVFFWPITHSFLNVGAGQTINITGTSQALYLGAGQTIEIAMSHFGSGGNVSLDSLVINLYDLANA